jgi:hypothetical protein
MNHGESLKANTRLLVYVTINCANYRLKLWGIKMCFDFENVNKAFVFPIQSFLFYLPRQGFYQHNFRFSHLNASSYCAYVTPALVFNKTGNVRMT